MAGASGAATTSGSGLATGCAGAATACVAPVGAGATAAASAGADTAAGTVTEAAAAAMPLPEASGSVVIAERTRGCGWRNGLLTTVPRRGCAGRGAEAGAGAAVAAGLRAAGWAGRGAGAGAGAAGAGGAVRAGLTAFGDSAWCSQISPGCGGDSRVRRGGCQAGWRRAETASKLRWRGAGAVQPGLPADGGSQRSASRSGWVGAKETGGSSGAASGAAPRRGLRANRLRQVSPNTIGAASASTPSINSKAPVQPNRLPIMPASARPAEPPALDSGSVPLVSASRQALAHSTASVPSQTRNEPGPASRRSPASLRVTSRQTSGTIQKVENPNQPKPIIDMPCSKLRAAIVAVMAGGD
ncbi:hypothetical protein D9M72_246060 [compost metagenome]